MLLQSSPLFHWVPVQDEPESSEEGSIDSTTRLHRSGSQYSIASQRSIISSCSQSLKSGKKSDRPSSLFISPPPSPRAPNITVKVNDVECVPRKRKSTVIFNEEIAIPIPSTYSASSEALDKLRERDSETQLQSPSDDESTPLVSELSTPTHSTSEGVFKYNSSQASPTSVHSVSAVNHGGERCSAIEVMHSNSMGVIVRESATDRSHIRRQNANVEDWDNPETTV